MEATGRAIKAGKKGCIPESLNPILTRLNVEPKHWISTVSNFEGAFGRVAGTIASLDEWREQRNSIHETDVKWFKGNKAARKFYNP